MVFQEDLGLESLLAQYVTPEVIDNAHCPNCAKKRSATKDNGRSAIKRTLTIGKVRDWNRSTSHAAWGRIFAWICSEMLVFK